MNASFSRASSQPSALLGYGVATGASLLALGLTLLLRPFMREPVFALFYVAVLVSAWYGGLGPSLLATLLSVLLANYFVFAPFGQFVFNVETLLRFGVEIVAALLISSLTAARRHLAASLRAQHEHLQVTLASIGDAVITTDSQGWITFLNRVAESLTGWSLADALGKDITAVFPIIDADTRQPVESLVAQVLREGRVIGLANHSLLIAQDGTERPIDDTGAPITNHAGQLLGVVLVFRDITARAQAEAALLAAHDQLAVILSSVADGVVAEMPGGRLAYANDAAARVVGFPSVQAMLNASSTERLQRFVIMDEQGRPLPSNQLTGRLALQGEEQPSRVIRYRELATGQERWALVQARPVRDAHGQVVLSIAITHDITAQKQTEGAGSTFTVCLPQDANGGVAELKPVARNSNADLLER